MAIDLTAHANTRARLESVRLDQCNALTPRMIDDGMSQRVLTTLVETGSQAQHFIGVVTACPFRTMEYGAPLSQGSGLVDDERVDLA